VAQDRPAVMAGWEIWESGASQTGRSGISTRSREPCHVGSKTHSKSPQRPRERYKRPRGWVRHDVRWIIPIPLSCNIPPPRLRVTPDRVDGECAEVDRMPES
jgi:hypothetical protein